MRDNEKHQTAMKQNYKQYLRDVSEQIKHDKQKKKADSARERKFETELILEEQQAVSQLRELEKSKDKRKKALLEEMRQSTVDDRKSKQELKRLEDAREIERMKQQDEILSIHNREHLQRKKVRDTHRAN